MNADVEFHIKQRYPWSRLPANVKQQLGNSQEEYEKCIVSFSVRNQLRHKGNLVRNSMRDDKRYYETLLQYSREHLMLFPYHLSNVIVKGMRVTPFQYYVGMMQDLMIQEKSYDSLPNFTAADCLRLLGIGRNQYIDLMNKCRSSKRFFRRKPVKDILPTQPVSDLVIEPWWSIQVGYVTEDDMKMVTDDEKRSVDAIIDNGCQKAGDLPFAAVHGLYLKGLVYIDVPIVDNDCIIVPPLEGFVMNRVLGDYLETLLYKIFVSIDEHTTVAELANILQIDTELVKNAVSVYCRLGFAHPKGREFEPSTAHPTWEYYKKQSPRRNHDKDGVLLLDWPSSQSESHPVHKSPDTSSAEELDISETASVGHSKRIAFLFDSTLTAFLMMGNLSPGLKSHAVTMFEVGKLPDESLDSLLAELDKIVDVGEGEAQRYFDHALTLHSTVRFLRNNRELTILDSDHAPLGLDLIRCESLQSLDEATCARLLHKNYSLLVSMAPLSNEIRPVTSCLPPHLGPPIPEVNSIWFKLFIYQATGYGPPTLLLSKGSRMRCLPKVFLSFERLLVTTWGHDPGVVPTSNALLTLNDALTHSAVLVQGYGRRYEGETIFVPFPFNIGNESPIISEMLQHPAIRKLATVLDLKHFCGYVTMVRFADKEPTWHHADSADVGAEVDVSVDKTSEISDVSSSSSDWPRDGIKDKRAAKILISELDKLDPLSSSSLPSSSSHNSVAESESDFCGDDLENMWTLLDCYFGLPLFDCKLNKDISGRISQHNLSKPDNLIALTHSSRILTIQLLEFISNIQNTAMFADGKYDNTSTAKKPIECDIISPCQNLIFEGGKLEVWNGR